MFGSSLDSVPLASWLDGAREHPSVIGNSQTQSPWLCSIIKACCRLPSWSPIKCCLLPCIVLVIARVISLKLKSDDSFCF